MLQKQRWTMWLGFGGVTLSIVFWMFFIHQRWTGTFHESVITQNGLISESQTVLNKPPTYSSNLNQFFTLKKCKEWGMDIRSMIGKNPGEKEDAVVCRKGCVLLDGGLVKCVADSHVISTFVE